MYLAIVGSVIGFTAYVWLLDNAPISQVVTHQYVNPLVAVALGALLLDERPGLDDARRCGADRRRGGRHGTARGPREPSRRYASTFVRCAARNSSRSDRVRIATGFPARATTTAAPLPVSSAKTSSTEAPDVDRRERRLHRNGDVVVERVRVPEDAVEEAPLLESSRRRPSASSTGSVRTTGSCEMP